jgi:predicted ATPase
MSVDAGQATESVTWASVSRSLRTVFGFAQEDWAAWLDVSRKTVQRWERGTAAPDDRVEATLVEFCRERDVFARANRAGVSIGVGSIDELCDVVSAARRARPARVGPPSSAPADEAGLLGRAEALADLQRLLGEFRLVTITGPGGVGKTTLARAARVSGQRIFVELATVRDPELVLGEIAEKLGAHQHSGRTIRDSVVHRIDQGPTSLVLDNLEHLPQAFPIVDDLLASCSRLRVLATSRAPLGLHGEVELRLAPLGVNGPESASVGLFLDRARRADPTIQLGPPEIDLVVEVCGRLDGLPLAIELGAARLKSMALVDLHARVHRSLGLLGRGPRNQPTHQESLRESMRWSYELLGPDPARFFLQLGCLVGGCTLDVAELLGADEALDDLATLVDSSLVYRDGRRYRLLETAREFSVEVARSTGVEDELTATFTTWATNFAIEHAGQMRGPTAAACLDAVSREHANLREALRCLLAHGDGAHAHRLATALASFWDGRSLIVEARRSIELTLATAGAHPLQRATLLTWLGYFCTLQNELAAATRHAHESLSLWEAHGIDAGIGYARVILGRVASEEGRLDDAVTELVASEQALERAGDTWGMVRPINALGEVERARGRWMAARAHHLRALALCRQLGDQSSLPSILCDIAHVSLDLGNPDAACDAVEEAFAIATELENLVGITNSLDALGRCRLARGNPGNAVELWAEADVLHAQLGLPVERRDQPALARDLDSARASLGQDGFAHHWDTAARSRPRRISADRGD